jgi:hypothetical protein
MEFAGNVAFMSSRRTPWSFLQANPLLVAHFVAPGVAPE